MLSREEKNKVDIWSGLLRLLSSRKLGKGELGKVTMWMDKDKYAKHLMRVEKIDNSTKYIVHDIEQSLMYYIEQENLPDWMRLGVALLSIVDPEVELDKIGYMYKQGVYYLEVRGDVPEEIRITNSND